MSNGITAIRVHRQDLNGVDSLQQIPNINSLLVQHSNGLYSYTVNSIQIDPNDSDAFYLTVKPAHNTVPIGTPNSAVVFSPYSVSTFKNSDYNATINNATDIRDSKLYFKVDRQGSQLAPANLAAINAQSLPFADIQDSNYDSLAYTGIRYEGSPHTATDFNTRSSSTGLIPTGRRTPYFCIFDYISGFSPEHNQANAVVIKYIVDEDGNVISPDSTQAQPILEQAFPDKSKFNISIKAVDAGGSEATLLGEHESLKGGQRIEPLLYSYTAATYLDPQHNGNEVLQFRGDPTLETYDAKAAATSSQAITNSSYGATSKIIFSNEVSDDRGNYLPATSIYTFGQDTEQPVKFSLYGKFYGTGYVDPYDGYEEPLDLIVRIQRSTDGNFSDVNTTTTIAEQTIQVTQGNPVTVSIQSNFTDFSSGDQVRASVQVDSLGTDISVASNRIFRAISETPSTVTVDITNDGYFFTASYDPNNTYLTASADLSEQYGRLFEGLTGSLTTSGFNTPNLAFEPKRGDEIKFNGLEKRTHLITEVITPSENANGLLYLKLNGKPSKTSNPSFFAIRRYVPASNMVLMSIPRVAGTSKNGILFPKFPSEKLEKDYEFIISELERKQIL